MVTNRSYDDSCGVAHAMDLVGERWALLVVRELMLGAKRFSDLKADLPGISSNVLSHRLDGLEQTGIVTRHRLPPPAASWVYELSPWGLELEPVIRDLGRWAARSPTHRRDLHFGVTSLVLSLRTNFHAPLAADVTSDVELHCGEDVFHAHVQDQQLQISRGAAPSADAVLTGDPRMFASVVYGGRPLDDALSTGDLTVAGSRAAAEQFLALYSLPEPASLPA